jgi:mannosyltransferase
MLLAVVAFAAVTSAVRSRRWWWWAVAGVAIFATAAVQVLAVLSFMVLPLALAIQRVDRRCWWSFSLMATAAGAAFAPIGLAEIRQGSQVSWIPEFTVESFWALPQNVLLVAVPEPQWFSWLFVLVPVGALIVATVNGRLRTEAWRPWAHIALLAGWFGLPVAAVVLGTAVGMDLYVSRYLAYATPAVALLMASALSLLRARPAVAAAVSLVLAGSLAVTSAGQYSWFRSPDAKQDARAVAAWIGDHHRAGDGVVFDTEAPTTGSSRNLQVAYPDDFEGLVDLRLRETAARANTLFAQDERLRADRLAGISRVLWVVRAAVWTDELESTGGVLWGAGFNQHEEFLEEGWIVVVMER